MFTWSFIFFTYSANWLLWLSLNTWGQTLVNVLESRRFGQIKLVSNLLRITPLSVNFAMLQTSLKFKITIYHCWWSASWLGGSADLGQTWLFFAGFLHIPAAVWWDGGFWTVGASRVWMLLSWCLERTRTTGLFSHLTAVQPRLVHTAGKRKQVKKHTDLLTLGSAQSLHSAAFCWLQGQPRFKNAGLDATSWRQ